MLSAAADFRAYGIDCNPYLIEVARYLCTTAKERAYLDVDASCTFAVGNIHQGVLYEEYVRFAEDFFDQRMFEQERHLPLEKHSRDPYATLGISLAQTDVIYGYFWPEHLPFLCSFLSQTTRKDALFILPFYSEIDHGEQLHLSSIAQTRHEQIYRRER